MGLHKTQSFGLQLASGGVQILDQLTVHALPPVDGSPSSRCQNCPDRICSREAICCKLIEPVGEVLKLKDFHWRRNCAWARPSREAGIGVQNPNLRGRYDPQHGSPAVVPRGLLPLEQLPGQFGWQAGRRPIA